MKAARPESAAGGLLALLEAEAWSAGLPGAGRLAATAQARGFYQSTLYQQWEMLHGLLSEYAAEAAEPHQALRKLFEVADSRVRFFLPGAWTRLVADGGADIALDQLREWCAGADPSLTDSLPAFGLRPWAERLGPAILQLLQAWIVDPNPEVRRAVVVALRPRGTWAAHLSWADETPSLLVPLFDAMRGEVDPRVAGALGNALNDVSHGSPQLVLALLHRWREEDAGPQMGMIARRGLRTLLKAGDPRALQALDLRELRVEMQASLRGSKEIFPPSNLIFDLVVRNLGEQASAHLVYEIETTGKLAGRPRRQRVQAGTYLLPARDTVRLIVRERVFDRKAAPLVDGPGCVRFFLNGEECAEAAFLIRRP
ncbi:MAG: hypothetical protein O3A20_06900 [Planctomycetota bacterium]|nr:hypothetical protein [Planctomycetota bacterium]